MANDSEANLEIVTIDDMKNAFIFLIKFINSYENVIKRFLSVNQSSNSLVFEIF